jgi:hypothetical protein
MIALTIIGLMLGAILGLRFRVLVLVPVTLFGIVGIALVSLAAGLNISWMAVALATLGLDLGYLGMTAMRFVIVPAQRLRGAPAPATLSKSAY